MSLMMDAEQSVLLIVDIQERLCPVMDDPRRVLYNAARLIWGADRLRVPLLVSEQYPKGLGPTMVDLRQLVADEAVVEKTAFSCAREDGFMQRVESIGRRQAVVAGIEAHVCVQQTALGLKEKGFDVFVVVDACSSRSRTDQEAAVGRMAADGCRMVTTEMVLFEWLGNARNPAFKDIQQLIK